MDLLPPYIHKINPRLKHIYLSFDDSGNLIIRSPKVPLEKIERLLLQKSAWITQARQKVREKKGRITTIDPQTRIYYLGQDYPMCLKQHEKRGISLHFDGIEFCISYDLHDPVRYTKHLDAFYKKEIQRIIPPLVEKWAQRMKLIPQEITFRKTKRQWGSCSAKNKLSFNTMLCKLPIECIEYVIVHELAHIRYKHHQKPFWDLVGTYLPDYKQHMQTLKSYTT